MTSKSGGHSISGSETAHGKALKPQWLGRFKKVRFNYVLNYVTPGMDPANLVRGFRVSQAR